MELVPILVVGGLVVIFILSYLLNKRTPAPLSTLTDEQKAACTACNNVSCGHHGGA
ncbi:hypothetical protein [Candidatus Xianfuyuplasma coldseepsis]|uniref:Uncharacterized protein n=1 Tax=Candidatus Xianfuyuplasma coldseepsis TaxID=2782163 RepID=A0A7L7KPC7_9MOLU|nr:hypothetical protein [Xianfuyuplasma coldseepsis]QMS84279.1 hypothetical protein G4Z02_00500 [Xianfuyuplasma coldseepsis]